jgi:hypothetical protein
MNVLLANLSRRNGSSKYGIPARYRVAPARRMCAPSSVDELERWLRPKPRRSPQPLGSLSTDGQFRKQVQVRADLMLQQFTKAEAADNAQQLCQFCREQQSSSEPLRWIAGANRPPLFFHEFLDSRHFPITIYTGDCTIVWKVGASCERFLASSVLWRVEVREVRRQAGSSTSGRLASIARAPRYYNAACYRSGILAVMLPNSQVDIPVR